jgi:ABC-type sugar transport system ATPase subunit
MADLELRGVSKRFDKGLVLNNICIKVPDGTFAILLGPSGCGKSTLLRIIAGLEPHTSGQVLIDGAPVDRLSPADRDIAMVFQHYALYPHLSVRGNLAFGLSMRKTPRHVIEERIADTAQLLNIQELLDRKPKDLSGGQRQRVAMGRAMVRKPKLFLFDEPLSNLDAQLRTSTRIELKKLQQRLGATMIYVTHDQVEAMTLGDVVVVMDGGHIRQADPPHRTYLHPASPFVASFIGTPPMNLWTGRLRQEGGTVKIRIGELEWALPPFSPGGTDSFDGHAVLGIRPEDIRLEPTTQPAIRVEASIDLNEDLGADQILHCSTMGESIVVRVSQHPPISPGQTLSLSLPHDTLHLFVDDRRIKLLPNSDS